MFLNPQMYLKSMLTLQASHDANIKRFGVVRRKQNIVWTWVNVALNGVNK